MIRINTFFLFCIVMALSVISCKKTEQEAIQVVKTESKKIKKVFGIGKIEPEYGLLYIYANSDGKIVNIHHKENEIVNRNTVLISMDTKIENAQIALEKSKITAHTSSVIYAEKNLKSINVDLQKAKEDLLVYENLFVANVTTEQLLKDNRAKVQKLLAEYNKQLAEIEQVKSKRYEIDANINYKNVVLRDRIVTATHSGKVLQWDVHIGDYISAGQKIGQFAPKGALVVVTEIDELFAQNVQIGMKADILSQLNGQKIGDGEVVFLADFLKKKSLFSDENTVEDRRVRTAKIRLSPQSKAIINSKVNCIIIIK
jgi:HlyD family secretion protein